MYAHFETCESDRKETWGHIPEMPQQPFSADDLQTAIEQALQAGREEGADVPVNGAVDDLRELPWPGPGYARHKGSSALWLP